MISSKSSESFFSFLVLSAACFNAHASYEITINKKKVVGSAQHRKDGVILQHGSIVIDFDVDKLFEIIKTKDEETKERAKKFTLRKASGIENELDIKVDIVELEKCIIQGIKEYFNVEIVETPEIFSLVTFNVVIFAVDNVEIPEEIISVDDILLELIFVISEVLIPVRSTASILFAFI